MSRVVDRVLDADARPGGGNPVPSKGAVLRSGLIVCLAGLIVGVFTHRVLSLSASAAPWLPSGQIGLLIAGFAGIAAALVCWIGGSMLIWRLTPARPGRLPAILTVDASSFLAALLLLFSLRYYGPLYLARRGMVSLAESGYADKIDPVTVGFVFLVLVGLLFGVLKLLLFSGSRTIRRPVTWLWILLSLYVVAAFLVHRLSYDNFSDHEEATAIFAQAFHNFRTADSFFVNSLEGGSHLGIHASYFMFLLYPIFFLSHSMDFFFLITPLFTAAAAYIFFRFATDRIGPTPSLVLTLSFLLYPTIAYQSMTDFHEMAWALPFFFLAVYSFERRSFSLFLISVLFVLLVKENLALTVAPFGLYALVRRRSIKWIAAPLALSGLWLVVTTQWLIPLAAGGASYGFVSRRYGDLGLSGSVGQMALGILQNPGPILRHVLSPQPIKFVVDALSTGGFVSLLWPFSVLAVEPFLENVLQQEPYLVSWQATMIPPILYVSLVFLIEWAARLHRIRRPFATQKGAVFVSVVVLFMNLAAFHLWVIPSNIVGPDRPGLPTVKTMIPPDVAVRAPSELLPHLAFREVLYGFAAYNYGDSQRLDYLVVKVPKDDAARRLDDVQIVDGVRFQRVFESAPYVVLRRIGETPQVLSSGGR